MSQAVIKAETRTKTGKGSARAARREGKIPAVVYSHFADAVAISLDPVTLSKTVKSSASGFNTVLTLEIEGAGSKMALLKDWQIDPVSRKLLHADFIEIKMDEALEADVPVELVGTPAGVTAGGVLSQIRREVTVKSLPGNIPTSIKVDVSGMDVNDSLHVADLAMPENVEAVYSKNYTIAVLTPPEAAEGAAEGAEAAAPLAAAPAAEQAEPTAEETGGSEE